jgi:hypothetical protein
MNRACNAERSNTNATRNRGVASRILRALAVSPSFKGAGAPSVMGTGARGRGLLSAVSLLVALAVVLLVPAAASAAPKGIVASFGQEGSAEGQFSGVGGVAVNQTSGDVYVVDSFNERVQQFDADGTFIRMWGGGVLDGSDAGQVCAPDADPDCGMGSSGSGGEGQFAFGGWLANLHVAADGSVYVADTGHHRIQQFTPDGVFVRMWGYGVQTGDPGTLEVCDAGSGCLPGQPGDGNGQLSSPISVAVDPTSGDVLVADRDNSRIVRFTSSGGYVSHFSHSSPNDVAVDVNGAVYAIEPGAVVRKYDSAGEQQPFSVPYTFGWPSQVATAGASVFITDANENGDGYNILELDATSGEHLETHRTANTSFEASGLAVNSATGRMYVGDGFNSRVFIFDDPLHTATIEPSTDITTEGATLHGTVNPNGGFPTGYHFEVSVDGETWTSFPDTDVDVGNGSDPVEATADATGLEAGRHYQVRLVATNQFGARVESTGTEGDFTTKPLPPIAITLPATQIRDTSAVVAGEIDPRNAETTYHFEYGTTTAYGTPVPMPGASAGAGGQPVIVTDTITGLQPNTTYHYRVVATNAAGTTNGENRTFTTRPATTAPPGRAYELVSPAYKVGGTGVGHYYGGPDAVGRAGYAAWDAERFAVHGQNGSVLTDGKMTFVDDWSFAERTPTGWVNKPGLSRRTFGVETLAAASINTAAEDFSLTAWGGGNGIRVFPEMESWAAANYPVMRRWTEDMWQLFGPFLPEGGPLGNGAKTTAADGSALAVSSSSTQGLTGPGDPSLDLDLGGPGVSDDPSSVYLDEITGPFSDTFPGDDGIRELVNVCTAGTVIPTANGSEPCAEAPANRDARLISLGGAALTVKTTANPPASIISADGSRLFFMSPDPMLASSEHPNRGSFEDSQLYVRQRNSDGRIVTRWISQTEVADQSTTLRAPALFEGASRDGDKLFFRTTSPLTSDDPNHGEGTVAPNGAVIAGEPSDRSSDLYMYDLPDGPDGDPSTSDGDPAGGDLTRISAGPDGTGDCNSPVQVDPTYAALRFASHDASRVYFTCASPLAGAATTDSGNITDPGGTPTTADAANLYLYDASEPSAQRWRFITRLPSGGGLAACATTLAGRGSTFVVNAGTTGDEVSTSPDNSCVRGTSDGSLITFATAGRLIADDPDADSLDIYGYDADRDELTRLSAPQGGPNGTYPCLLGQEAGPRCHADPGIGPGPMALEMLGVATRPGPDDGDNLAFFQSARQLVPQDADSAFDVYQWRNGELSLISTGHSETDGAFYLGNDRTGLNVYFATRDQLTWQDKDRVLDVYTARVGGGIPEPIVPELCGALADGCRGSGVGVVVSGKLKTSSSVGGGDVVAKRQVLSLRAVGARARRRAARTGRLTVSVGVSEVGVVRLAARARLEGRSVKVAGARRRVREPGVVRVGLPLSSQARGVLRRGRPLRLVVRASQLGARSRSITVRLPGVKR